MFFKSSDVPRSCRPRKRFLQPCRELLSNRESSKVWLQPKLQVGWGEDSHLSRWPAVVKRGTDVCSWVARVFKLFMCLLTCVRVGVGCLPLQAPENGYLRPERDLYDFGSGIVFKCEDNYDLIGNRKVVCLKNSQFSGPVPTCQRECFVVQLLYNIRSLLSNLIVCYFL